MNLRRLLGAAAALALLAGCSDAARSPVAPGPPEAPSRLLGLDVDLSGVLLFAGLPDLLGPRHAEKLVVASEGGFVELNGFRVDIPAGALPYDAVVTIDLPTTLPLGKRVMAEFGPHGIQFNTPVTLTFPLTGVVLGGGPVGVARWENGAWTPLGGAVSADGTELVGTTPHFSVYAGKYVMAGG